MGSNEGEFEENGVEQVVFHRAATDLCARLGKYVVDQLREHAKRIAKKRGTWAVVDQPTAEQAWGAFIREQRRSHLYTDVIMFLSPLSCAVGGSLLSIRYWTPAGIVLAVGFVIYVGITIWRWQPGRVPENARQANQ